MAYYIGIDLGGTNMVVGLVDGQYNILAKAEAKTNAPRAVQEIAADLASLCSEVMAQASVTKDEIAWVGTASPGVINREKGEVENAANLGFLNAPLAGELEKCVGLPVYLENDANAAAYGEFLAGSGKGCSSLVEVTLGTGVGGGVILNGQIQSGAFYGGSELGHMVLMHGGRSCTCGRRGCMEAYVSATGLIKTTKDEMFKYSDSVMWQICGGSMDNVDGKTAFEAAVQGDAAACRVVDFYIDMLACGIANLVNIYQPEVLCIGGGIAKEGEPLIAPVREIALREILSRHSPQNTKIVAAQMGGDAAVIGAAFLGKQVSGL